MSTEDDTRAVPRLALRFTDAAKALDMSVDSFERYVASEIRILVCGRMKRAPISSLNGTSRRTRTRSGQTGERYETQPRPHGHRDTAPRRVSFALWGRM
jgi:hypothetical protein